MREIQGLKWVRVLDGRPAGLPQGRPRGAKARGVAFEKAVAESEGFGHARHGMWLGYEDVNGIGFAQPDFVFAGGSDGTSALVVAEVKLTWTTQAYRQLRRLYWPLLQLLVGAPIGGIVVCQGLTRESPKGHVVGSIAEALCIARSEPGVIPVLHLPLVKKEGVSAKSTRASVPSWWRKGEATSGVGSAGRGEDFARAVAWGDPRR